MKKTGFQQAFKFIFWHRRTVQKSLDHIAAQFCEELQLLYAFHTFNDHTQPEAVGDIDHTGHNIGIALGGKNLLGKGQVDLERIEGKMRQVIKRCISRPKIIDCQPDSQRLQSG